MKHAVAVLHGVRKLFVRNHVAFKVGFGVREER